MVMTFLRNELLEGIEEFNRNSFSKVGNGFSRTRVWPIPIKLFNQVHQTLDVQLLRSSKNIN